MKSAEIYADNRFLTRAALADSYFLRLRGLIGRDAKALGGMLLKPCSQIHTFFMKENIDVLYLSREGKVLKLSRGLCPGSCFPGVRGAAAVLELPEGAAGKLNIYEGSILDIRV